MQAEIEPGQAETGKEMHDLVTRLFPICRSITGNGVRETLRILGEYAPWTVSEVPSGTPVLDWAVPKEWNVKDAYVEDEAGNRVIDFRQNNLHLMGYSVPVDAWLSLEDLQKHLHSLEELPDAIPYVTSYYAERWGFCLSHNARKALTGERYHVRIDSELKDGGLTMAELVIKGSSSKEVLLSTYVCHPSMANNELSGPVVATFLARWLASQPRRYTYRIVIAPETIGAITYISQNLAALKKNVVAGFVLSCLGDDLDYSCITSPYANTLADRVALHVLKSEFPKHSCFSFLDRGSDERQYCSPGVSLPVVGLCRSKYGEFPQYHTSLDDLDFVTPEGLAGGYRLVKSCIEALERNARYRCTVAGEPQLGRRGLYPTLSTRTSWNSGRVIMDFLAYADGSNDLVDIANTIGVPVRELFTTVDKLLDAGLIAEVAETE